MILSRPFWLKMEDSNLSLFLLLKGFQVAKQQTLENLKVSSLWLIQRVSFKLDAVRFLFECSHQHQLPRLSSSTCFADSQSFTKDSLLLQSQLVRTACYPWEVTQIDPSIDLNCSFNRFHESQITALDIAARILLREFLGLLPHTCLLRNLNWNLLQRIQLCLDVQFWSYLHLIKQPQPSYKSTSTNWPTNPAILTLYAVSLTLTLK